LLTYLQKESLVHRVGSASMQFVVPIMAIVQTDVDVVVSKQLNRVGVIIVSTVHI
jgi:hypothetical protein